MNDNDAVSMLSDAGKHELWVASKGGDQLPGNPVSIEVVADTAVAAKSQVMCCHYFWGFVSSCSACPVFWLDSASITDITARLCC